MISSAITNTSVGSFVSWEKRDSISYVVDYLIFFPFEKVCVVQLLYGKDLQENSVTRIGVEAALRETRYV